jgi:hypothetical protein
MRATSLAIAVLSFLVTPASGQTPQWVIRDVGGSIVGPVLGKAEGVPHVRTDAADPPLWVARYVRGQWLMVLLTRETVWGTRNKVPFLYETPDCSSPALLDAPRQQNEASLTVAFDTHVYWPSGRGASLPIRSKGVFVHDPAECGGLLLGENLCCTTVEDDEVHFAAQAAGIPLSHLELRPPFHIEAVARQPDH